MREMTIEELKAVQVDITCAIHAFCEEHGLRYFLHYGTLLGAVRHKGFIPWDEDIDLGMPRPDYDYFVHNFNAWNPDLEVFAPELDLSYYAPFANVCDKRTVLKENNRSHGRFELGVKVDIFPMDGAPADDGEYSSLRDRLLKLNHDLYFKSAKLGPKFRKGFVTGMKALGIKAALALVSVGSIQRRIREASTALSFEEAQWCDQLTFPDEGTPRMKREVFENYVDLEFEGHKFKAPRDYDLYLKAIFGDYMTLPPESERVPHHGFQAWWK